jgi:hypothetical protein
VSDTTAERPEGSGARSRPIATNSHSQLERHGAGFWISVALGGGVIAFGVRGAVHDAAATGPADFFVWIVAADLLHDLLVAPLVCVVGFVLTRTLPEPWRTPVRSGLIISALVVAVAWAGLRGYGRDQVPDNPTVQPLDYGTSVLTVLAVVWTAVAIWVVVRVRSQRRGRS